MIKGVGIDLESIGRVKKTADSQPGFIKKILTAKEIEQMNSFSDSKALEYLVSRFSAKESFSKALGSGIGENLSWQDIEILNDSQGKPNIFFQGKSEDFFVSISHKDDYVITEVIIEVK